MKIAIMNVYGTEKRHKELPDEFYFHAMHVVINCFSSWFYKVYLYFTFVIPSFL